MDDLTPNKRLCKYLRVLGADMVKTEPHLTVTQELLDEAARRIESQEKELVKLRRFTILVSMAYRATPMATDVPGAHFSLSIKNALDLLDGK